MESLLLVLRVLLSLAAVFGLLFYLRKRLVQRLGAPRAGALSVIERHNVGPKSSVVLIEAEGKRYLLGVGEASVNMLDSYPAPQSGTASADPQSDSVDFAALLHDAQAKPGEPALLSANPDRRSGRRRAIERPDPLAGSILSVQTWRKMREAVRPGRGA